MGVKIAFFKNLDVSVRSQICKNIFQITKLRDYEEIVIWIVLEIWLTILLKKAALSCGQGK